MLKVTLDIIPFGDYSDKYTIHAIYIANVGGDKIKASYDIWFDCDPTDYKLKDRPKPHLHIKSFKRNQGALELTRQALNKWYTKLKKEEKYAKSGSAKASAESTPNT